MNRKWGLIWVAVMACIVAVLGGTGEVSAQTSADGQYEYELDQVTGNATLTKYLVDISSETEVVVPQQIDGHPVTALAGTYQGRDKITKVTALHFYSVHPSVPLRWHRTIRRICRTQRASF